MQVIIVCNILNIKYLDIRCKKCHIKLKKRYKYLEVQNIFCTFALSFIKLTRYGIPDN